MVTMQLERLEAARRAGAGLPFPASADPDLIAQFDARVQRMFGLLEACLADRTVIADFRHALHQVAGTAAFFDRPDLGTLASRLDAQLGEPDCATAAFLNDARTALRRAARGAS